MTAGFWLRVNGKWMPLEGVQAGVPLNTDRSGSELVTLGGRRSISRAKQGPRDWPLDFSHATPEAVRLLALAAHGQAGEVMLLDLSAARANMLDPLACVGPSDWPLMESDGIPLRSLTPGGPVSQIKDVMASANVTLASDGSKYVDQTLGASASIQSLLRFALPAIPGATLTSARLLLSGLPFGLGVTLDVRQSGNDWIEDEVPVPPATWSTVPTVGVSMGSGADTSAQWNIPLAGVSPFLGTALSIRLRRMSGSPQAWFHSRSTSAEQSPRLRLTFALPAPPDRTFTATVRAGQTYTLSAFTSAAAGASVVWYNIGAGGVAINAPAGTGSRRASATFTPAADVVLTGVVPAATTGLVGGLRLTEGISIGPWVPGEKTPCKVSVADPEKTLNFLLAGEQGRSNYRVTLKEVG